MNVYDFDKTIYYPDCSFSFIFWCLRRYPQMLVRYLPKMLVYALPYALNITDRYQIEEKLFSFLPYVDDLEQEVRAFWAVHQERISPWYLAQKAPDDLIISASPEFLLKPMTDRLGVRLIATQLDMKTGKLAGFSCYGRQKVRQVLKQGFFPEQIIHRFYSDSLSDTPMALCAEEAFLVVNKASRPVPWPKLTPSLKKKIMKALEDDMT